MDAGLGAIRVIHHSLGAPRRASWFEGAQARSNAQLGIGGVDLQPGSGSALARREERMARRPRLYAARHVAAGVAKVLAPLLLAWLLARLAGLLPDVDLPAIPLPDIDLPSIPRPDWQLPTWARWIAEHAKYLVPVLVGLALAGSEINRRAKNSERRARLRSRGRSADATPGDDGEQEV